MKYTHVIAFLISVISTQAAFACNSPMWCESKMTMSGKQSGKYICGCNDPIKQMHVPPTKNPSPKNPDADNAITR